MFGTSLYHASNVFLAFCPLGRPSMAFGPEGLSLKPTLPVPHPYNWLYFVSPTDWRTASSFTPGTGPTSLIQEPDFENALGELSVGWHSGLRRWLMSTAEKRGVVLRAARNPLGPWSRPVVIFHGVNPAFQASADNLVPGHQFENLIAEEQHPTDEDYLDTTGSGSPSPRTVVYAPYLILPWMRFDRSVRALKIHYTLSTGHPPYNVQLMHSTLSFR